MRVCIIGAGISGLVSAKYALSSGFVCDVLEAKSEFGGTWVYTDRIGTDEYGFKLYSAMYPGLSTNLPKEVMSFPDFQANKERSFLDREDILDFVQQYVNKFNISPNIKLNRQVEQVKPTLGGKWEVTSIDKPTKTVIVDLYDSVMVCAGMYNEPSTPKIAGRDKFKGPQIHRNAYRTPAIFENKRVLTIGGGPSARDIVRFASLVAKNVVSSHHHKDLTSFQKMPNVEEKPDVTRITGEETVEFEDGSTSCFDIIVYCTGYKRSFPFLTPECGVTIEDYQVKPLYKFMVSVTDPTLCFIGLLDQNVAFRMVDLQVRFYMKYLTGSMKLPPKEQMLQDAEAIFKKRSEEEKDFSHRHIFSLRFYQADYIKELADAANVPGVPPVIVDMWAESVNDSFGDIHYRNYNYEVVDNDTFIKTPL